LQRLVNAVNGRCDRAAQRSIALNPRRGDHVQAARDQRT
jgi:hypothetical protein